MASCVASDSRPTGWSECASRSPAATCALLALSPQSADAWAYLARAGAAFDGALPTGYPLDRFEQAARPLLVGHGHLQAVAAAPKPDDGATTRQVRLQLQESERRQQREFDLRFAEMARDFQSQRQADLVKFDRVLGLYQNRTGMQVAQQQQQLKSLAQRVSQQP